MTYQVLARKWRPRNFSQLVGQEHVVRALVNGLDNDRLHHAFLFTGTRGVGKTTIARILAKSLNCEKGVSSQPCGECGACSDINDGRFVDLIEVDAASRTKVDDTRELLENVQYAPTRGRYKVYLIDEVHMLSGHSFNALLKTLEEPPPHVKFLFATTDPQKLPVTILSRCLQFNLKRLPAEQIAGYLKDLLDSEAVTADEGGIRLIARAADGSMRDALSLLDQAISYGGGRIQEDEVGDMIGTVERGRLYALLEALVDGDADALWRETEELGQYTPDFAAVLGELSALFHRIAMAQFVPAAVDADGGDDKLKALADKLDAQDVQLYYQIAVHSRRDLELAPDPRSGFEMALLRMLAFRPASGQAAPSGTEGSGTARPAPTREASSSAPAASQASAGASVSQAQPVQNPPQPVAEESARYGVEAPRAAGAPVGADDWEGMIQRLGLKSTAALLAGNSRLEPVADGVYRICISAQQEHLRTPSAEEKIRQALARFYGRDVKVQFEVGDVNGETPAQKQVREADERLASAKQAIDADPVVKELQSSFGGEVIDGSVRPGSN